ncbi:MAG: hypothetical protein BJ554DRAFT_3661, partial [Olpidium bornovanus]
AKQNQKKKLADKRTCGPQKSGGTLKRTTFQNASSQTLKAVGFKPPDFTCPSTRPNQAQGMR